MIKPVYWIPTFRLTEKLRNQKGTHLKKLESEVNVRRNYFNYFNCFAIAFWGDASFIFSFCISPSNLQYRLHPRFSSPRSPAYLTEAPAQIVPPSALPCLCQLAPSRLYVPESTTADGVWVNRDSSKLNRMLLKGLPFHMWNFIIYPLVSKIDWENLKISAIIRNIATNVASMFTRTCRLLSIVVTSSKYVGNFGHRSTFTWS